MNKDAYKQFNNAVVGGIGMFVTLRLRGCPAEQNVNAMIDLWLAILEPLREWDNEDIANLQRAFIAVAREVEEWPTPKAVINKLEPKVKVSRRNLPPPPQTKEQRQEIDNIIQDIFNTLNINKEEKR